MKIIDEKGRFFGKINVIDFLVILLVFCILPAFYFGYKIMTKKTEVREEKFIKVEVNCRFIKLEPEVLKLISVGDTQLDEKGQVVGEIIRLGEYRPYRYAFDIGAEKEIIEKDASLKEIEVKLKLKAGMRGDKLYYKDTPLNINTPIEFRTDKYSLVAIPFKEEESIEDQEVDLFVSLKGLDEDMLKEISVGDKEVDERGQAIAEILSLGKIENDTFKLDLGGTVSAKIEDRRKKQISTKIKLKCQIKDDGELYFKGEKIKYNTPFEFKTNKYKVKGLITETLEKAEEMEEEEENIDLAISLKGLDEDMLKEISVGDKEVDERGQAIAEILSLDKIEDDTIEFNLGKGNFATGGNAAKRQISTKMRLKCQIKELKDDRELYFKGKKIEYNRPIEFKTDKYRVEGEVAKTYEMTLPLKERWISLQVKFSGVLPEIANIVQKGDVEKGPFEKTTARIISIINNTSSQVLALKEDKFITLVHPFNKDLLLVLDVQCTEKEGIYYFKNYPVKMGNNITFATDLYSITGVIIAMGMK